MNHESRMSMRLLQDRKQTAVLFGALRRERPLLAQGFVELRTEEAALHAAVDDVPREHAVAGPVAEHVEVRIDAGFGARGTPVARVALRRFDYRCDPAVAERQQRLVERMPL